MDSRVISKPYELIEASFGSASADASAGVDAWLSKVKASFLAALDGEAKLAQVSYDALPRSTLQELVAATRRLTAKLRCLLLNCECAAGCA